MRAVPEQSLNQVSTREKSVTKSLQTFCESSEYTCTHAHPLLFGLFTTLRSMENYVCTFDHTFWMIKNNNNNNDSKGSKKICASESSLSLVTCPPVVIRNLKQGSRVEYDQFHASSALPFPMDHLLSTTSSSDVIKQTVHSTLELVSTLNEELVKTERRLVEETCKLERLLEKRKLEGLKKEMDSE